MLIQEVIHNQKQVPVLTLDEKTTGNFSVMYDHCGQIGKSRSLTLLSDKEHVLKKWEFADGISAAAKRMNVEAKDVVDYLKKNQSKVKLVYTSEEIPNGRTLALLSVNKGSLSLR
jgi:hypothetical protein